MKVDNIKYLGNLKFSHNNFGKINLDDKLKKFIKSKKLWCAVSTHPGEEKICVEIHQRLLKKFKNLILIIIPRHIDRINDIIKEISSYKLGYHIHSNKSHINNNTKLYLVDTYGETNLFLKYVNMFL